MGNNSSLPFGHYLKADGNVSQISLLDMCSLAGKAGVDYTVSYYELFQLFPQILSYAEQATVTLQGPLGADGNITIDTGSFTPDVFAAYMGSRLSNYTTTVGIPQCVVTALPNNTLEFDFGDLGATSATVFASDTVTANMLGWPLEQDAVWVTGTQKYTTSALQLFTVDAPTLWPLFVAVSDWNANLTQVTATEWLPIQSSDAWPDACDIITTSTAQQITTLVVKENFQINGGSTTIINNNGSSGVAIAALVLTSLILILVAILYAKMVA